MQTATERMNFHQPEKSLPNRPHPAEFYAKEAKEAKEAEEAKELQEPEQPKQEESKVERKPKRKTKSK